MFRSSRKTAMKVRNGRVCRKNRFERTHHDPTHETPSLVVDRRRPGWGFRHLVRPQQVRRFLEILPERDRLLTGLNAVVLDAGGARLGWHRPGVVAICAWDHEIVWDDCTPGFYLDHKDVFDLIGIPVESGDNIRVHFTAETARAFLLVHVLVHELGHHFDCMSTARRERACRGERFAEEFSRQREVEIFARYQNEFEL